MEDGIRKRIGLFFFDTLSGVSTSDSSDDEEQEPKRKIAKVLNYVEKTVISYDSKQFQFHFRMRKGTLYMLIGRLENSPFSSKHECGEVPISSEKAMLLSVWYLANNETFRQICDRYDVSISSAHRVLIKVLEFLLSLKKEYIVWPSNEWKHIISESLKAKQGIDNIIGAIDGSHIRINRPVEHEETYVNRKQYHSLILQAVADHQKFFTDVCCGEPGSVHDARVLRRSSLYRRAQDPNYFGEYFLIGDSAYPALNWIVTPFKDNGNLTENQKLFNFRLSSTGMIIEHTFGLLKGRFRRLLFISNLDIGTCIKIMMCCCILHNICIIHKDDTEITLEVPDNELHIENNELCNINRANLRRHEVVGKMFPNN